MAEASFYMNDEEELEYYDSSNNNDWFEECHGKGNHIVMPHYTAEVPEMFSFKSPAPEPVKPDPLANEPTGSGYHEELNTLCNSLEPLSSQIEFSSTEQEDHQLKPEDQEEEFFPQIYTEPELIAPVSEQSRIQRSILQISMGAFSKRTAAEKGKRFETKNLCKHVHTETMRHLKKRDAIHQFAGEEREQVKLFCHTKASIDNFKDLFRNPKIALLCREFYESPYFIKEILASKMEMGSKLTIIKYLEKMRKLTHDPDFKAWKKENN